MRTQRWLLLSWTVASSSTSVALASSSVQSLFIANKERTCHRFPRRHHSTVPPVIHRCERTCKSSSVSLVGDDEHHCDDTNDGEVTTKGRRLVDSNVGTNRGHHERDRRAVLAALLLVSSPAGVHPNPASADDGGFFGGDTPPRGGGDDDDDDGRPIPSNTHERRVGCASDRQGRRCVGAFLGRFRIGRREE